MNLFVAILLDCTTLLLLLLLQLTTLYALLYVRRQKTLASLSTHVISPSSALPLSLCLQLLLLTHFPPSISCSCTYPLAAVDVVVVYRSPKQQQHLTGFSTHTHTLTLKSRSLAQTSKPHSARRVYTRNQLPYRTLRWRRIGSGY